MKKETKLKKSFVLWNAAEWVVQVVHKYLNQRYTQQTLWGLAPLKNNFNAHKYVLECLA